MPSESDITGITMPVTKHNYLVKRTEDLGHIVREAFYIAQTGRQGPVLVDLPKDVTTREIEYEFPENEPVTLRGYQPTFKGHARQIEKATEMIADAERPLIYAGGGVIASNASSDLVSLAESLMIPVTTTLMGLGAIPCTHPLNLGMLGMHGTRYANYAVTECDLLIAIGVRFDDRVTGNVSTFAPNARIIHIDIDPAEIGKNKKVDVPIVGDVGAVLSDLLAKIRKKQYENWMERIRLWKEKHPMKFRDDGVLRPQYVVRELSNLLCPDDIVVSEVGQNQMWTAQYYCFKKPRTWITSGGSGRWDTGSLPQWAHTMLSGSTVFDISR